MTNKRPFTRGTLVGTDMSTLDELGDADNLEIKAGKRIVDDAGVSIVGTTGGVVYAGTEVMDATIQRTTDPKLSAVSPRGALHMPDVRGGMVVLTQTSGLWTVGSNTTGVQNDPEQLSALYRTRFTGTYTGSTGAPAVDMFVRGTGWTARIMTLGGSTFALSLLTGVSVADTSLNVYATQALALAGGATSDTLTGCVIPADYDDGYADATGYKAPRNLAVGATGTSGFYNVIGTRQDEANGSRFPYRPEYYHQSFQIPKGEFAHGSMLEIVMTGVVHNDAADAAALVLCLNMGANMFISTALAAQNLPGRIRLTSPDFPPIANEEPIKLTVQLSASRKVDRTEGNIAMLIGELPSSVWGGSGTFAVGRQRGTDRTTSTSEVGWDLEDGDDTINKRTNRDIGVWLGAKPEFTATGSFYVNLHSFQVRLIRGIR